MRAMLSLLACTHCNGGVGLVRRRSCRRMVIRRASHSQPTTRRWVVCNGAMVCREMPGGGDAGTAEFGSVCGTRHAWA